MTKRIEISKYLRTNDNCQSFEERIESIREFAALPTRVQNQVCKACRRGPEKKRIHCKPGLGCLYYQERFKRYLKPEDLHAVSSWTKSENFVVAAFSMTLFIESHGRWGLGFPTSTMNLILIDPKLPGKLKLETHGGRTEHDRILPDQAIMVPAVLLNGIPPFGEVLDMAKWQFVRFLDMFTRQQPYAA